MKGLNVITKNNSREDNVLKIITKIVGILILISLAVAIDISTEVFAGTGIENETELVDEDFYNKLIIYDAGTDLELNENYVDYVANELFALENNYSTKNFSQTRLFRSTNDTQIARITFSGTGYFYEDGKVHLYSISISVQLIDTSWAYNTHDLSINNTDGSISSGYGFVSLTNGNNSLEIGCMVRLTFGSNYFDILMQMMN